METDEEDVKVNFAGVTKEIKSYNTFKETYGISNPGAYGISISKKSDNSAISPTISNLALYAVTNSKYSQLKQTVNEIKLFVTDGLENTGINITNRTVDVQADNFSLHNNSGEKTMGVDAYGNMYIKGALQYDKVEVYSTTDIDQSSICAEYSCLFLFDDDPLVSTFTSLPSSTIILTSAVDTSYITEARSKAVLLPPPETMLGSTVEIIIPARASKRNSSIIYLAVGEKVLTSNGGNYYVPKIKNYASISDMVYYDNHAMFWMTEDDGNVSYRTYLTISVSSLQTHTITGFSSLRLCAAAPDPSTPAVAYWYVKSFTKYSMTISS